MSHRDKNPEPAILEALVAEVGIERAVQTLDNQGLAGYAYRYLLNPLFAEAIRRRGSARAPAP